MERAISRRRASSIRTSEGHVGRQAAGPLRSEPVSGGNVRSAALAVVIGFLVAVPVGTQQPTKLGTVTFPISCSPAAQTEFVNAVVLLHSFWFSRARDAFEAVSRIDPACGMAHWGTAMTLLGKRWSEATRSATSTGPLGGPPPSEHAKLGA